MAYSMHMSPMPILSVYLEGQYQISPQPPEVCKTPTIRPLSFAVMATLYIWLQAIFIWTTRIFHCTAHNRLTLRGITTREIRELANLGAVGGIIICIPLKAGPAASSSHACPMAAALILAGLATICFFRTVTPIKAFFGGETFFIGRQGANLVLV